MVSGEKTLDLIKDYLSDRTQIVKINETISMPDIINAGMPQGSILGTLFFIIFVNDLLEILPAGDIISYADDKVILSSGKTWNEAEQKMNR